MILTNEEPEAIYRLFPVPLIDFGEWKPKYQLPANSSIIKEFSRCIFLNVFVFSTSFAVKTTTKIEKVFLFVWFLFSRKRRTVFFFLLRVAQIILKSKSSNFPLRTRTPPLDFFF